MRILIAMILTLTCLFGCASGNDGVADGLKLREQMTKSNGCSFVASVTADYGNRMYSFTMDCVAKIDGTVDFMITEPESIKGIKGSVSQSGGKLLFEDTVLLFDSLTSNQITPAIAPYLMVKAIQGGYIQSASSDNETVEITLNDSFRSEGFQAIVTLVDNCVPIRCEIFFNNRRILTISVKNFELL